MTRPEPTHAHHGTIAVHRWPGGRSASIVALPGVDGSGAGFTVVAELLGSSEHDRPCTIEALDLRGRGGAGMDGPFGVAAHASDVIAFLERRSEPVAALVGHSFGGHVASRVAADRPDLLAQLVLVDGGPPRIIPAEMTARGLAELALGNIIPNLAAKPHSVSEEAVRADFVSMVADEASTTALAEVRVPVSLIRAGHGMAEGMPPVITDAVVDATRRAGVDLTDLLVPAANHFSLLGEQARSVVDTLRSIV